MLPTLKTTYKSKTQILTLEFASINKALMLGFGFVFKNISKTI
jgi:hypothetical protein